MTPIIIAAYNMAVVYLSLNIFISIIIEAFEKVRAKDKENLNEFDFYKHVALKIKRVFKQESRPHLKNLEYKDHLSVLPKRINDIINFFLRVNSLVYFLF